LRQKGYEIFKARGIAFRDKQKVYTKGSEVGYSLKTIERILTLNSESKQTVLQQKWSSNLNETAFETEKRNEGSLHLKFSQRNKSVKYQ
jgi:hypothetical protein